MGTAGSRVFLILILLLSIAIQSNGQEKALEQVPLSVGFTRSNFLGINRNDAEAAFKAFTGTVGRRRGYAIRTTTTVYETISDYESAVAKGEVDLSIIDTWDYLSLRHPELVEPQFVVEERGVLAERYLLLTRRESGLNTLADLRGKNLRILENANAGLGRRWIETRLLEDQLGGPEKFFGKVESAAKASSVVLPVFFGQTHACVVDQSGFNVIQELNPQVGKALQVRLVSEPYVDSVVCFSGPRWSPRKYKEDMYRGLAELHLEPAGRQILTIFRTTQVIPFKESHLETVKQLRAKHDQLQKELKP